MTSPIGVLVVDTDPLARRALVQRLGEELDFEVTAVPGVGAALAAIEDSHPSVVVLDARVDAEDGLEAMREILAVAPDTRVLVLSNTDDTDLGLRALRGNAAGYLSKGFPLDALGRIIHSLARGEAVISRDLTMRLIEELRKESPAGRH